METEAEYKVSSGSDMPRHAYKELLCLDYYGNYYG